MYIQETAELKISENTVFTQFVPQGYHYFLAKNQGKTFQIVPHCGIIQGCATILFYPTTL